MKDKIILNTVAFVAAAVISLPLAGVAVVINKILERALVRILK